MLTRIVVCLLLAVTSGKGLFGTDVAMKVTDKNYLDTQGFSVFLYDSTYHPVFVDQKNTAMEMILHGQRIATNGDVRLMPTPEQWDLVATLKGRHADKENNRLTADLAFPTFDLSYTLTVEAEPGGVKVSINLDKALPEKLAGRAGFNLEFLPSIYMGKAYLVDGSKAGIFPRTPDDPMVKVLPLADEPKKAYYLDDWDKAKGYTEPLPFAEGKSITLGVDDKLARINVKSDTSDLMLFDGRNRAQNGWFVLRSLIPSGKTTGAIVWHIRPDVIPNWTRPPNIAHSQVGYAPDFSKVAVIELGLFAHSRWLQAHSYPSSLQELVGCGAMIGEDKGTALLRGLAAAGIDANRADFAFRSDSNIAQFAALRAGLGVGVCQVPLAARYPMLQRVLGAPNQYLEVWLVTHPQQRSVARLNVTLDALAAGLADYAKGLAPT